MAFASGTAQVGSTAVPLCRIGNAGARVRNLGSAVVFLGGPDVGASGERAGYPLDPGTSELFYGGKAKEIPVVPAPPGDLELPQLYARTAPGTGPVGVSWIGAEG